MAENSWSVRHAPELRALSSVHLVYDDTCYLVIRSCSLKIPRGAHKFAMERKATGLNVLTSRCMCADSKLPLHQLTTYRRRRMLVCGPHVSWITDLSCNTKV
jgi:hypothetical protein